MGPARACRTLMLRPVVAVIVTAALSITLSGAAFAQAGSTGGIIGKTDKSASGGKDAEQQARPERDAPLHPHAGSEPHRKTSAKNIISSEAKTSSCRLAGVWAWSTGGDTAIRAGGMLTKGSHTATWSCKNNEAVLVWSHGYIDHLSLSPDGTSLSGTNNYGVRISATRKE
jgi:hypothetical protein